MVHLGKMHLETALFFESVEEIYARVFRTINPRTAVPNISVEFREYANANSRIRLCEGELTVRISDLLKSAPAPVQEALACILLSKLFRRRLDGSVLALYQRYLNRAEIRHRLQQARRQRGRKAMTSPAGQYHHLEHVFEKVNELYFNNSLRKPRLGWTRRASRNVLGHYDPAHHAIVLSRLLDTNEASKLLVEYVMFHEMLHIKHPTEHRGERRCIHTKAFKDAERTFADYARARAELKIFSTLIG